MKIAIIGAGAMGCLFGTFLSEKHEVILLEQNPERIEALNSHGVTVEEFDGTKHPLSNESGHEWYTGSRGRACYCVCQGNGDGGSS